jgi:poly(A) polymerase
MQLTASWLKSSPCLSLKRVFEGGKINAFFVGGCVRNSLMGEAATDFDLATPLLPNEVMVLAKEAGIKAIPTGIEHGTVTLVVENTPFEITTFRHDLNTDGRHATVAFSTDITSDAQRRDFTMNAIYADFEGHIYDPLGGLPDLQARYVRFIGDPEQRIREDYLRILRFFRFHATYGAAHGGLDAEALAACAAHLDGLAGLSRERVTSEILKLLSAKDPSTAVGAMEASGVLRQVLPGASVRGFFPYVEIEFGLDPMARLAALGGDAEQALRLSNAQLRGLKMLRSSIERGTDLRAVAQSDGEQAALNVAALRAALFEQPLNSSIKAQMGFAAQAKFPVAAADLMPEFSGAPLGAELKRLKADWIASGFSLTRHELLNSVGNTSYDTD